MGGGWVGGPTKLWPDTRGMQNKVRIQLKPSRAPVKRRMGCNIGTHAPGMRLRLGMRSSSVPKHPPGRWRLGARRCKEGAGWAGGLDCKGNSAEGKWKLEGQEGVALPPGGGQGIRQVGGHPFSLSLLEGRRRGSGRLCFLASRVGLFEENWPCAWALGHCPHSGGEAGS